MRQIYLDYNATTPIAPSVRDALLPFFVRAFWQPVEQPCVGPGLSRGDRRRARRNSGGARCGQR